MGPSTRSLHRRRLYSSIPVHESHPFPPRRPYYSCLPQRPSPSQPSSVLAAADHGVVVGSDGKIALVAPTREVQEFVRSLGGAAREVGAPLHFSQIIVYPSVYSVTSLVSILIL